MTRKGKQRRKKQAQDASDAVVLNTKSAQNGAPRLIADDPNDTTSGIDEGSFVGQALLDALEQPSTLQTTAGSTANAGKTLPANENQKRRNVHQIPKKPPAPHKGKAQRADTGPNNSAVGPGNGRANTFGQAQQTQSHPFRGAAQHQQRRVQNGYNVPDEMGSYAPQQAAATAYMGLGQGTWPLPLWINQMHGPTHVQGATMLDQWGWPQARGVHAPSWAAAPPPVRGFTSINGYHTAGNPYNTAADQFHTAANQHHTTASQYHATANQYHANGNQQRNAANQYHTTAAKGLASTNRADAKKGSKRPPTPRSSRSPTPRGRFHNDNNFVESERPEPDAAYLAQASLPPRLLPSPQPLLVIVDLNGTLLCRSASSKTAFRRRPFLTPFLRYLLRQHTVMVWTSARPHNAAEMCAKLLDATERAALAAVWARDTLGLTPAQYAARTHVYKRLTRAWAAPEVQAAHPLAARGGRWGQANTVLVDDSARKAAAHPHSLLHVPELTREGAAAEAAAPVPVLRQVAGYLEEARRYADVSAFMRATPFRLGRWCWDGAPADADADEAVRGEAEVETAVDGLVDDEDAGPELASIPEQRTV